MRRLSAFIFIFVSLVPAAVSAGGKADACGLLTKAELETVQGAKLEETIPSAHPGPDLDVSQCFYKLEPFVHSVSVELVRDKPGFFKRAVARRWEASFHKEEAEEREKKERDKGVKPAGRRDEEEEERNQIKPDSIAGLGKEAFLVGGRTGSVLYVWKKHAFVRISLGNKFPPDVRLAKLKELGRLALARM